MDCADHFKDTEFVSYDARPGRVNEAFQVFVPGTSDDVVPPEIAKIYMRALELAELDTDVLKPSLLTNPGDNAAAEGVNRPAVITETLEATASADYLSATG